MSHDGTVLPANRSLFHSGAWTAPADGRFEEVINPATLEGLGRVAVAGKVDVDAAVNGAREGFEAWRRTPALERAVTMRRAAAVIRAHAEDVAKCDSMDSGGPYRRMVRDSNGGAEGLE